MTRILVTDDNSEYRQSVMELLELEGYQVIEAADGETAIQLAKTAMPALILCDVDMPVKDGFAVLSELKASLETASIPVLLLTGHADVLSIKRGYDLGASDYLLKPVDIDILLAKIRRYLNQTDDNRESLT